MNDNVKPTNDLPPLSDCGIATALNVIGGKWTLLILRDLFTGPKRFSELERSLTGISTRTLSQRLEELTSDGIILRDCTSGHPVYSITAAGTSLQGIIELLRLWGASRPNSPSTLV
jgi:DNA-binding HxlR family transcriptional regulator